jgi:hypothetical protein
MERKKKIHINLEEAIFATTAGVVMGAAIGGSKFMGTPPIEGVKIALSGLPVALIGAGRLATRIHHEKMKRHTKADFEE